MKVEKLKNNILNIGKKISIITIIGTVLTYILSLLIYAIGHSGDPVDLYYFSEVLMISFTYGCFYCGVFVLSTIFISGVILTSIVATKKHNPKEFIDSRFIKILTGIILPLGLGLLWELYKFC